VIGGVWIERLAENGILEHPSDFYALTKERLLEFDRVGEVSAARGWRRWWRWLTKAEKFEVEVVDQGEIWQRLIAAGVV
jgi:NAD-dependent DNA ligase